VASKNDGAQCELKNAKFFVRKITATIGVIYYVLAEKNGQNAHDFGLI